MSDQPQRHTNPNIIQITSTPNKTKCDEIKTTDVNQHCIPIIITDGYPRNLDSKGRCCNLHADVTPVYQQGLIGGTGTISYVPNTAPVPNTCQWVYNGPSYSNSQNKGNAYFESQGACSINQYNPSHSIWNTTTTPEYLNLAPTTIIDTNMDRNENKYQNETQNTFSNSKIYENEVDIFLKRITSKDHDENEPKKKKYKLSLNKNNENGKEEAEIVKKSDVKSAKEIHKVQKSPVIKEPTESDKIDPKEKLSLTRKSEKKIRSIKKVTKEKYSSKSILKNTLKKGSPKKTVKKIEKLKNQLQLIEKEIRKRRMDLKLKEKQINEELGAKMKYAKFQEEPKVPYSEHSYMFAENKPLITRYKVDRSPSINSANIIFNKLFGIEPTNAPMPKEIKKAKTLKSIIQVPKHESKPLTSNKNGKSFYDDKEYPKIASKKKRNNEISNPPYAQEHNQKINIEYKDRSNKTQKNDLSVIIKHGNYENCKSLNQGQKENKRSTTDTNNTLELTIRLIQNSPESFAQNNDNNFEKFDTAQKEDRSSPDFSFLDDIDIDEIVEVLNMSNNENNASEEIKQDNNNRNPQSEKPQDSNNNRQQNQNKLDETSLCGLELRRDYDEFREILEMLNSQKIHTIQQNDITTDISSGDKEDKSDVKDKGNLGRPSNLSAEYSEQSDTTHISNDQVQADDPVIIEDETLPTGLIDKSEESQIVISSEDECEDLNSTETRNKELLDDEATKKRVKAFLESLMKTINKPQSELLSDNNYANITDSSKDKAVEILESNEPIIEAEIDLTSEEETMADKKEYNNAIITAERQLTATIETEICNLNSEFVTDNTIDLEDAAQKEDTNSSYICISNGTKEYFVENIKPIGENVNIDCNIPNSTLNLEGLIPFDNNTMNESVEFEDEECEGNENNDTIQDVNIADQKDFEPNSNEEKTRLNEVGVNVCEENIMKITHATNLLSDEKSNTFGLETVDTEVTESHETNVRNKKIFNADNVPDLVILQNVVSNDKNDDKAIKRNLEESDSELNDQGIKEKRIVGSKQIVWVDPEIIVIDLEQNNDRSINCKEEVKMSENESLELQTNTINNEPIVIMKQEQKNKSCTKVKTINEDKLITVKNSEQIVIEKQEQTQDSNASVNKIDENNATTAKNSKPIVIKEQELGEEIRTSVNQINEDNTRTSKTNEPIVIENQEQTEKSITTANKINEDNLTTANEEEEVIYVKTIKLVKNNNDKVSAGNANKETNTKGQPKPENESLMSVMSKIQNRLFEYLRVKYTISGIIHKGNFSNIFFCESPNGKIMAAKVLKKKFSTYHDGFSMEMKLKEILNDGDKTRIVNLINGLNVDGSWCFLFEYYPQNLKQALSEHGNFHIEKVQILARQLLAAVFFMRKHSMVHTAIKPGHILINAMENKLKLCGFDESYLIDQLSVHNCKNSNEPNYRAPEVILGYSNLGYGVDVWSAALVIHEMATNKKLFPGSTTNDVLFSQIRTLGSVPFDMLRMSAYWKNYYTGKKFIRINTLPNGNTVKEYYLAHQYYKTIRANSMVYKACKRDWRWRQSRSHQESDWDKVHKVTSLLNEMLVIDPHSRISIEFAFADPFIYEYNNSFFEDVF